mgnify:CR=1 FL=1
MSAAPALLLTRPETGSRALCAELQDAGYAVYNAPMLNIHHHDGDNAPSPHGYQAIVITSANAAPALRTIGAPADMPVFAVGDASTQAAKSHGMRTVISADGDSGDLRALITTRCRAKDGALLYIRGRDVAGDLAGDLQADGLVLESWIAYRAKPVPALPAPAAGRDKLAGYDAVLFFSQRTARHFAELVHGIHAESGLQHTLALCISHKVLSCVHGLPWAENYVARRPDRHSMIALTQTCVPVD